MMQDEVWQEILLACIGEQFQLNLNQGYFFQQFKNGIVLNAFLSYIFLIVREY